MLLSTLQVLRPRLACSTAHRPQLHARQWHTLRTIRASPSAARRVPTPLVLLAAPGWARASGETAAGESEGKAEEVFKQWAEVFGQNGWDATLLDVGVEAGQAAQGVIQAAEAELSKALRTHAAFPPLLIAHGAAALIAQAYVSSAPLTGLILHDAPLSLAHAKARALLSPEDATEEFNFEARFPALCTWSGAELARQKDEGTPWYAVHRLEEGREEEAGESLERVRWELDEGGAKEALKWAEDEGIEAVDASHVESSVIGFDDVEDYDGEEDDLEWEADADEDSASDNEATTPRAASGTPPAWFTSAYTFSTQGSKKQPLNVPESDFDESFIRGRGPGGQAINKLSTCVALLHVPSGTRIVCQETRSRTQNRVIARRRMSRALEELLRGEGSVNGKKREKERKKKGNREKKARRRARERAEEKEKAV